MKKIIFLCLVCLTFSTYTYAQKTTTKIQDTQARMLDMVSDGYVKPLTVELKLNQAVGEGGKVHFKLPLTKEQAENELRGDMTNIRSFAIFKACEEYKADVIVAATFNFKTEDDGSYLMEVVGFPANFINWKTMTNEDLQWIALEKTQSLQDKEKIKPIIKK